MVRGPGTGINEVINHGVDPPHTRHMGLESMPISWPPQTTPPGRFSAYMAVPDVSC